MSYMTDVPAKDFATLQMSIAESLLMLSPVPFATSGAHRTRAEHDESFDECSVTDHD